MYDQLLKDMQTHTCQNWFTIFLLTAFLCLYFFMFQNCPEAVHELMLKCWNKEHVFRPRFEDILDTIDEWIESPECHHYLTTHT